MVKIAREFNSREAQPLQAREACEGRGEGRRAGVADGVAAAARGEGGEADFLFFVVGGLKGVWEGEGGQDEVRAWGLYGEF